MQLKLFIEQLQALYATYDDEYKQIAGEPEIMVDCFERHVDSEHKFYYAGFHPEIRIEKSSDYCYDIINLFGPNVWNPKTSQVSKPQNDSLSTSFDIT